MRSLFGVLNIFGSLLTWFALYFLLPIVTGLLYGEVGSVRGFVLGAAVSVVGGVVLRLATRRYRYDLKPRDAYLLVTVGWLTIALVATIPLLIDLPRVSFTQAYFESMSGLSTTGATQLNGLDALPHSINIWRHALSWLGGMGIIVLAVAILPLLGVGGMQLYRAGAPGTIKDAKLAPRITETAKTLGAVYAGLPAAPPSTTKAAKLAPRITETAKPLGAVYAGLTAACALALWAAGMPPFDAIC